MPVIKIACKIKNENHYREPFKLLKHGTEFKT